MPLSTPCPVCSRGVYTDLDAPMAKRGTDNPARHSCVDNGTWRDRRRFGGDPSRLRERLRAADASVLERWPRVAELQRRVEAGEPLT